MMMQPMKWFSFSGTLKETRLIVPGVDVASEITPRYLRMNKSCLLFGIFFKDLSLFNLLEVLNIITVIKWGINLKSHNIQCSFCKCAMLTTLTVSHNYINFLGALTKQYYAIRLQ